jgi:membrane-associated phospholipid phosphatase
MTNGWIAALACVCIAAPPVTAQVLSKPDTAAHRANPLFIRRDLYIAAGFAAGAVAMFPIDRSLANHLQDSTVQANRLFSHGATAARILGSPGAYALPFATYIVGRVLHKPHAAELGLHTLESVVMAEMVTSAAKSAAGRARPVQDPDDPFNYNFGRGLKHDPFRSMPSGHTTAAFAAASAATSEVGAHWPRHKMLVGITLYTTAALVGASRMYNNQHWASDVVVGAAIGTFSGWKVVGYTHAHPHNPVDRILLGTRVTPSRNGGITLMWSSLQR